MSGDDRTIAQSELVAAHLASCLDGAYAALGASAPTLLDDGNVVAVYELGRLCGEIRHGFDELGPHRAGVTSSDVPPHASLHEVLTTAATRDPSGHLVLVTFATLIAPRLLISLRDAAQGASLASEGPLLRQCQLASQAIVASTHRLAVAALASRDVTEEQTREELGRLEQILDRSGCAESFGIAPVG